MKYRLLAILLLSAVTARVSAQDYPGVKTLAQRRVPWLEKSLVLNRIPADSSREVFEIQTIGSRLHINASSSSAAAAGLNWYLKYHCHRSMSHMGDNLAPVNPLPAVPAKEKHLTEMPVRYALNYCTISYTMSFYSWADWEHELDWMSLNGVNTMLATVGTEAVWQRTLQRIGYTSEAARSFVAGPGFTAWWLMGNLEGWGGPVPQSIIDQQEALQKKILARMKELGIAPVMQGFYGMVPTTLKDKMKLTGVVPQGKWAGGFQRPDYLLPADTAFQRMAAIYYEEMKRSYGNDIRFFAGDPFHEGGNAQGVDVPAAAKGVQQSMLKAFPEATWVLQGWQANPGAQLLAGLDKSKVLVQELFGENTANWEKRKGYESTPFIWCTVTNFGEKMGLYGKLQRFADEVYRAANSPYKGVFRGAGIMPEGIRNNPVIYDLMMELPWHQEHVQVKDWIKTYVRARYGVENSELEAAWQGLLETCYSSFAAYQEGPTESIFTARPDMDVNKSVSTWGTRKRNYDTAVFSLSVQQFLNAAAKLKSNITLQTDAVDFERQLISNRGEQVYADMMAAWKNDDQTAFNKQSALFLSLMNQQDKLLGRSPYFRLDTWVNAARAMGNTPAEKSLLVRNAKTQITWWGPDNPDTDLHEYANKEWNGLMKTLYIPRWEKFIAALKSSPGKPVGRIDFFSMEKRWSEER